MKKLILVLFSILAHAQEKDSVSFSKIHFSYSQTSNFNLDEKGIYADTSLIQFHFPNLKYELIKARADDSQKTAFIAYKTLSKEDKKKIASIIYHTTQQIEGVFDVNQEKTVYTITRSSKELEQIFHYLNEKFYKFKYKMIVDYKKKKIDIIYPRVSYRKAFNEVFRTIVFIDPVEINGSYTFQTEDKAFTNKVELNKELNKRIVPDEFFSNNKFGVKKIISLEDTKKLINYSYE